MRTTIAALFLLVGCGGDGESDSGTAGDEPDGTGGLTQEAFEEAFAERYCQEYDACSTSGQVCDPNVEATQAGTCAFDPVAAQACLDATWSCNADFPGLEFVVPADVCATVCG